MACKKKNSKRSIEHIEKVIENDCVASVADDIFDVEKVIQKRTNKNGEVEYLLQWSDTWMALNIEDQKALNIPQSVDKHKYKNLNSQPLKFISEVDKVMLRRVRNQTEEFKIKWRSSWCSIRNCFCPQKIRKFEELQTHKNDSVRLVFCPNNR